MVQIGQSGNEGGGDPYKNIPNWLKPYARGGAKNIPTSSPLVTDHDYDMGGATGPGSTSADGNPTNLLGIAIKLSEVEQKINPTLKSQLDILEAQKTAIAERIKLNLPQDTADVVAELKAQNAQLDLTKSNLIFQRDLEADIANRSAKITALEIDGQKYLASVEKIRLEFAQKITIAQREGNTELVNQLQTQKSLALLQNETQLYLETPRDRAARHEAERRQHRAGLRAAANDAAYGAEGYDAFGQPTGAYGRSSSRYDIPFPSTGAGQSDQSVQTLNVQTLAVKVLTGSH
jgi:hypothetical protein